jgi:hypothetical protein
MVLYSLDEIYDEDHDKRGKVEASYVWDDLPYPVSPVPLT